MPKIADYSPQVQVPLPSPRALARTDGNPAAGLERSAAFAGDHLTQGFDKLSQTAFAVANKSAEADANAWASNSMSQARLDWTQKFVDGQQNYDPAKGDFTPQLLSDYDTYSSQQIDAAPTATAKKYLRDRLNSFRDELGSKAIAFEAQAKVDWRSDQYVGALDNSMKLMNTDPTQFDQVLGERLAEIDGSAIPPIARSALRQKTIDKLSEAAVWSRIQQSPTKFLNDIGFLSPVDPSDSTSAKTFKTSGDLQGKTGDHAFDMLPFDRRVQLLGTAVQMKNQIDSDADRAAVKQKQAASDDAAKTLWGMNSDGKLNRTAIENFRPVLSVPEYRSLLTALDKPDSAQKTDPSALRQILMEKDPQAAEALAFKFHQQGLVSNADLTGEVGRLRTMARQEGPKSPYENGRQYIVTSMAPSPMIKDPVGQERMADAVQDFNGWYDAVGHKLAPDEVDKRARDTVHRYKIVDLSQTMLALPQPRYGTIRRNALDMPGVLQDVTNAGNMLIQKHDQHAISDYDYAQEMAILNRWKNLPQGKK